MLALFVGAYFLIQFVVLMFAMVLGKSAALADREFVRAGIK